MTRRSLITTAITAAIVVVILPLLMGVSAIVASLWIEVTAGAGLGMFGAMGTPHMLMLVWIIAATGIVTMLVALLIKDRWQHE